MYFSEQETQHLFDQIKAMMCDRSRLWFDQVSSDAVSDKTGIPEIQAFMDHMRMIGEPFIRGFENVVDEIRHAGFDTEEVETASQIMTRDEPIFEHYSFAVSRK
jgi:O-methyltransferase involved in polyketide biosynthesis